MLVLLSAALANAGHALVAVSPLVRLALVTRHAAAVNLSGHRALAQSALVWIGLLPVLFSAQQAALTLAAERERRSLTALLVAPITLGSILLGKLLGSLAPGLLMLGVAYAVYLPSIAHAAPDAATWLPLPLVLAVLFLLLALSTLMNSIALIIRKAILCCIPACSRPSWMARSARAPQPCCSLIRTTPKIRDCRSTSRAS